MPETYRPKPKAERDAECEARRAKTEQIAEEIAEIAAHIDAATFRLLELLREFEERCGWRDGFASCAHWLSWRTGISLGPAREKMRVARALPNLPLISDEMRQGKLSYSKVRALTRVATAQIEAELLNFARHGTTAHVERLVRAWRRSERLEELAEVNERHLHRSAYGFFDDDGMFVLRARLDPEEGAVVMRALEAAKDLLYEKYQRPNAADSRTGRSWPPEEDGERTVLKDELRERNQSEKKPDELIQEPDTCGYRMADALALLAESALGEGLGASTKGDRYQVVVHVDEPVLKESVLEEEPEEGRTAWPEGCSSDRGSRRENEAVRPMAASGEMESTDRRIESCAVGRALGQSALDAGIHVSAETSRRLACDGSTVVMTHDSNGSVLSVGRKTRTIPPALRRALAHRDVCCRFPGCSNRICDAHHVRHWANGGETRLENLLFLCRRHHRLVHEEGYGVELLADGEARFTRPDRSIFPRVPALPWLPDHPIEALRDRNAEADLAIDSSTNDPKWDGSRLDLPYALDCYMTLARSRQRRQAMESALPS